MIIAKVRSFFPNPEGVKLLILYDSKYGLGDLLTTGVPIQSLPNCVEGSGNSIRSLRCLSITLGKREIYFHLRTIIHINPDIGYIVLGFITHNRDA